MTGKRKSRKKPLTKVKYVQPLDKVFNCPFCHHELTCDVKIDRPRNVGHISCRICMETFQTKSHSLTEPIDVYNDWIDACEDANK